MAQVPGAGEVVLQGGAAPLPPPRRVPGAPELAAASHMRPSDLHSKKGQGTGSLG